MGYRSFRDFLGVLEQRGRLRRVSNPVDLEWGVAGLARWMFQGLEMKDHFGLMFDQIEGFDMPVVTGAIGASRETYAIALGVEPDEINEKWVTALLNPIVPARAQSGPSQEIRLTGDEIDLGRIPVPIWTPGKDAAPYITCPVITRDRDIGVYNLGVYRTMVRDRNSVIVNLGPGRDGTRCCQTFWDNDEPAPIAWAIGAPPSVAMAAVANVPYGTNEFDIAGGLLGQAIELVPATTIDLMVPAEAEIVIEGLVHKDDRAKEGPFGEFAGYMSDGNVRSVATITAITMRREPIYYGFISQMPPSESTTLQSIGYAGLILKQLRHDHGHETVRDVHVDLTFGGQLAHGIIAMTPVFPGHAKQVGRLVAASTSLKRITVVDDDVDIRDPMHMDWAMNARFQPARDTILIEDINPMGGMDPTLAIRDNVFELASQMVCDATQPHDAGEFSVPSEALMDQALELWSESGLPEFEIPKRVKLMLGGG